MGLQDHINTHTGAKPYMCTFCGAAFASHGTWRMHERTVHLGHKREEAAQIKAGLLSKSLQFGIKKCDEKSKTKQDFVYHASSFHNGAVDVLRQISDGSLDDIDFTENVSLGIKQEPNHETEMFRSYFENEYVYEKNNQQNFMKINHFKVKEEAHDDFGIEDKKVYENHTHTQD